MSNQLELIDPTGRTLTELADIANAEHRLAWEGRDSAVVHAVNCGRVLRAAKKRLRHGQWLPWLAGHFEGSEDTAQVWMRLARNTEHARYLDAGSVRRALRALGAGDDMDVHYSSDTAEWSTPDGLFKLLDTEFEFDLDVCATAANAKCVRYYTAEHDGLAQDWAGVCWMNPPYGTAIGAWMAKAHESGRNGTVVVCLVPARTDTAWWWNHAIHGEIRFLRGRLRFNDGGTAPFPSAVVIFGLPARVVWWER
jgi:phage N-6-adenine-methyltransferase